MVKKYLDAKGVKYEAVDVTDQPDVRNDLARETGFTTVPVTTDGREYIAGWNPAQLAALISKELGNG